MRRNGSILTALAAATLVASGAAGAREQVGTIVGAAGSVEVRRADQDQGQPAVVGMPVVVGDRLLTSPGAQAKIVFDDDSVVDLGGSAALEIDRYSVDPAATEPRSLLRLTEGKLLARISDFYAAERWRYEIETPTAITRATNSEVLVVFAPEENSTDVVVGAGSAQVRGVLGVIGAGVDVAAGQFTRVQQGQFPVPADTVGEEARVAYRSGLGLVGTGNREGLDVGHPLVTGSVLSPEDRPAGAVGLAGTSYLRPGVPGETLQEQLSPELRTNTQPIPEFETSPPGVPPSGKVEVDF